VAVIGESLWQRELGGATNVVGAAIRIGEVQRTVIGVVRTPPSERHVDVWIPRPLEGADTWAPIVVVWLRPGVSIPQAESELKVLAPELTADPAAVIEPRLVRPGERERQSSVSRTMVVFWAASGFLLAIVCTNLATLFLARNLSTRRETAIRTALGASRLSIVRQVLTEGLLVALVGGALGVLVALWATSALLAMRPLSLSVAYPDRVPLDLEIVIYSLVLSMAAGLAVGLVPAWRAARTDVLRGIGRDGQHVEDGVSARWMFGGAVVVQTALALVLLIGAGLTLGSYVKLQRVDPGFDAERVATIGLRRVLSAPSDPAVRRQFFHDLAARIAGLDGVREVAIATDAPPHGSVMMGAVEIENRPAGTLRAVEASWVHVTPAYFAVLRIPVIQGRPLTEQDGPGGEVVISESFARNHWPPGAAVGQRFRLRREKGWEPWLLVVGVARDVAGSGLRDARDEVYVPFATHPGNRGTIVARTTGDPLTLLQAMKEQLWALDPNQPISDLRTARAGLARSIDEQPFYATLLAAFAAVALALAAIGVFGVASYAALQRKREIGIRVAVGADAAGVQRMMLRQGIVPSLVGLVIGLSAALALGRTMTSLAHGISVTDPAVYISTALALVLVSLVANWLPARRASRLDPMLALRNS
jgi:predicted permease